MLRKRNRSEEWGSNLCCEWDGDEDEMSEAVGCCKPAAKSFLWATKFLDFSAANFRMVDLYGVMREKNFWVLPQLGKI